MSGYEIKTHAELGDIFENLIELSHRSFGQYDGVIAVDREFLRWYLRRPGMTPESRFAAVQNGEVVSNAFVTVETIQFGGERLGVGMVDTVMTHPDHRRRGLARRVLERATAFMRECGLDASQLYTAADSMPQRFYETIDYREYARVQYYGLDRQRRLNMLGGRSRSGLRDNGRAGGAMRIAEPSDVPALRRFMDESFAGHDGYIPLHDDLWAWRRELRPAALPVTTCLMYNDRSDIEGGAALASAPLRKGGGIQMMTGILDFAVREDAAAGECFEQVVSMAPADAALIAVSGVVNREFNRLCESHGFSCVGQEVSMLRPFSEKARRALKGGPTRWYTATESLIGI